MTEYQRLRGLDRWHREQLDVIALLNQWSPSRWGLADTTDGVGQIVRVGTRNAPIAPPQVPVVGRSGATFLMDSEADAAALRTRLQAPIAVTR